MGLAMGYRSIWRLILVIKGTAEQRLVLSGNNEGRREGWKVGLWKPRSLAEIPWAFIDVDGSLFHDRGGMGSDDILYGISRV